MYVRKKLVRWEKKKTTQNRGNREPEEEGWIFYWGQGWAANVVMSK